jgi:NitT/TauT family transport system ATP-binding protein
MPGVRPWEPREAAGTSSASAHAANGSAGRDDAVWVVDLSGVTVRYGERVVLQDLTLRVPCGQFLCVIGKSGCGKSTLLRAVAGLTDPQGGTVSVAGRRVTSPGQGSAMVFQADTLFPWKKVIDNAMFGLVSLGVPRTEARRRAGHWLERVGLAGAGQLKPRQLSGGMRQRVNLVRALVVQPSVLLMDEPFASLDYQTREELQAELIRLCRDTSMAVIFVTHDVAEAVYLADRIIILDPATKGIGRVADVPWGRERPLTLKHTPAFAETCGEVWRALRFPGGETPA